MSNCRKVLIVEDSPAMRGLIASILEQLEDTEIVEAEGGYDALKRLPGARFDLIISDINMPDINGFELLSFIRKHPDYTTTPVLIVTSEESQEEKDRSLALGANAVLAKPFQADALLTLVEELLE